ncbi:cytochrome P450 [Boletus reticuloceps]|uniref:Cytochrome P450 n=1 Tax=Boletus reticuloceps TaxID=495285 RepID=A0A8I2YG81_9AGAM|nr:cytochrome P450 [Boletus reticuloceps]
MYDWATTGSLALGCFVVLYLGQRTLRSRTPYPLPPGPPGLPWVGNVIGVDADSPWLTYAKWARTYGDLVYSRLLGKDIIIINSEKIANDLLEVRSKNYSDRPNFVTLELCGVDFSSIFMPYGDLWRLHRRFFHQTFKLDAVPRFSSYQHHKACHLLHRLLETPDKLDDHTFEYTSSVVLNSVYNYDPTSRKDDLVDMLANVLTLVVPALRPDINIILGAFPWLLYLPSWFPGMSFKRGMAVARTYSKQYLERPFEYSLEKMSVSVAPSMVHDAVRHMEEKGISPEESWMQALKEASGTVFLAASDTSNSVLRTFFLMMMVDQVAQEKAQAQIDAVVGRDRLPGMEDRPLLPFIDAIFRETLRYSPVAPLSIPHAATDDDVYDGYHIPKGAIILANVWSMAHDESRYPNPGTFIPERFLNDDGSLKPDDTEHIKFGFGRRMCVGRHFADRSMWAVMAKVLAVFKILRPLDEHGVEILVEPKFANGIAVHPLPYRCRIVPRFDGMDAEKLAQLIAASTA